MKILFLDFDGVIVTWKSFLSREDWDTQIHPADATACKFLERLLHYSKGIPLKLVISSSWRHDEADCKALLDKHNLTQYLHDDWHTVTYGEPKDMDSVIIPALTRGGEIQEWLDRHPEVEEYRILDDNPAMLTKQQPNFLQCDPVDGMDGMLMRKLVSWIIPKEKQGTW